jgi:O-antigen ligase
LNPRLGKRDLGEVGAIAFLIINMVLGGGGSTNPVMEVVIEGVFAVALFIASVLVIAGRGQWPVVPMPAWLIFGAALIIPLAQLVPLPPAIWHALPGREPMVAALALVHEQDSWRALSLFPDRTLASFLAMIPPAALFLVVASISLQQRRHMLLAITLVALASVVLGALQLSSGNAGQWSLYAEHHIGYLIGFQANRNAQADVLQIGILALVAYGASSADDGPRLSMVPWIVGLLSTVLAIGVLLTGSRAGIALLPLTYLFVAIIAWPILRGRQRSRPVRLALFAAPVAGLAIVLLGGSGVLGRVAARFSFTTDARQDLWVDAVYAAKQVWPVGGGIGSFAPLLLSAERLEVVDQSIPVRAHNDWLEWLIEGGAPSILMLAAIIAILLWLVIRRIRALTHDRPAVMLRSQTMFGLGSLLLIAAHSFVDYPLRSMSLATLAAVAAAMLIDPAAFPLRKTSNRRYAATR